MGNTIDSAVIDGLFPSPVSLNAVLDEIPRGVLLLDTHGRIVFMNRTLCAMTGYDVSEAMGLSCCNIIRSSICSGQSPCIEDDGNEVAADPVTIVTRQKQKIPVRISRVALRNLTEEAVGFLEIVEDLRARQKTGDEANYGWRPGNLVGVSPRIKKVFSILPMVAQTDSPVLITGESGTGKDVIAESIHLNSERARGPFVKVNCAALPETLLEAELFGHLKGAFPGASESKAGRFRLANNGTIFLSEVGDLPAGLQSKLLAFMDDNIVYPVGSHRGVDVNVRIVAATLQPLDQLVQQGRFRSDLLFRLSGIRLQLPPLRERVGDVRLLLEHMLRLASENFSKTIEGFSDKVLGILLDYHYPGNIRELKNIVEYAVSVCRSENITEKDLPDYVAEGTGGGGQGHGLMMPVAHLVQHSFGQSNGATWEDTEKKMILEALVSARGKKSRAADVLGWGRSTLWRKMKKYGLE